MGEGICRNPTRNFTIVPRVSGGVPLLNTGVLVEKIDSEIPTLYDCLARILESQMMESAWKKLTENLPLYKQLKKGSHVFVFTEKQIALYNCLISNVRTTTEQTALTQTLYTDDENFNAARLPRITKECQYNDIQTGKIGFINPENTYAIKTTTKFISGPNLNHIETETDYLIFIPTESIMEV